MTFVLINYFDWLLVGTYLGSQVSVHRTIGPLVLFLPQNIDCVPKICVLSKNKKNRKKKKKKKKKKLLKIFIIYNFKNLCILHGHVFIMRIKIETLARCLISNTTA